MNNNNGTGYGQVAQGQTKSQVVSQKLSLTKKVEAYVNHNKIDICSDSSSFLSPTEHQSDFDALLVTKMTSFKSQTNSLT